MSRQQALGPGRERGARFKFEIVGRLLAAPPESGTLQAELDHLAAQTWRHPTTEAPVRFARSTIERWYYAAKNARDPIAALDRQIRRDAGRQKSLSPAQRGALNAQYRAHPSWTVQLHYDNLAARAKEEPELAALPSYASVRALPRALMTDNGSPMTAEETPSNSEQVRPSIIAITLN